MDAILFSTPRTPRRYKRKRDPPSPLAPYSLPLPASLPSLQAWKKVCKEHPLKSTSAISTSLADSDEPRLNPFEFSEVLCALSAQASDPRREMESASFWVDEPLSAPVFRSDKAVQKRCKQKTAYRRLSVGGDRVSKPRERAAKKRDTLSLR